MISDSLVYSVISGEFCVQCGGQQYVFRQPGIITSSRIFNSLGVNEDRFKKDGFLSSEEEKDLLYKHGLWSDDLEKEFENTKKIALELTKHMDMIEEIYIKVTKEIEKRKV